MKKSLFFVAAASALMLTACSSENDVVQDTTKTQTTVQQQTVGFDVYTPAATNVTRAGLEGTMTTDRMKRSEYQGGGFGVYAYQVQDADASTAATKYNPANPGSPNFMANEKLLWNATNQGWYYNPLKYWPNETDNDSQNTAAEMYGIGSSTKHLDRLSFFAYAPYVESADDTKPGIRYITNNAGKLTNGKVSADAVASDVLEASIGYTASLNDPNKAVDLLWGVAPSGGLEYTAVNGQTVTVKEGMPLIDMTKPNVNTTMKFLFQHALARIGVTAVAAIDQVGAGGTLDPNTKITIEKITLKGYFGETGLLNLDNTIPSVAKWEEANGKVISSTGFADLVPTTLTLQANHTDAEQGTIATHLQFVGTPTDADAASATPVAQTNRSGVTTVKQSVIQPALIDNAAGKNRNWYTGKEYASGELKYSETTPYYTNENCTALAGAKIQAWKAVTKSDDGSYTYVTSDLTLTYPMELKYYEIADWYTITSTDETEGTYDSYTAYHPTTYAPTGLKPSANDKILKSGMKFVPITATNLAAYAGKQGYTLDTNTFIPKKEGEGLAVGDYVICGTEQKCAPAFEWTGGTKQNFYKRDANYFMVVPTNNFVNENPSSLSAKEEDLRTVTVMIEYYITTEDGKLANKRAQTKNVIEKKVVFPSLANGKSYNLNLILGLTSVKMEAEVDDWKVINVQADLPQNTSN